MKMSDRHFYSFDHLAYQAKTLFPTLYAVAQVDFVYIDEERERIVVSSQEEYDEALLILLHINPRVVRFDVKVPPLHSASSPSSAANTRQQQQEIPFRHCVSQNNHAVGFGLKDLLGIATEMCSAYQHQQTSRGPVRCGAARADTCPCAGPGAVHKAAAHANPTSQAAKVPCCPFKVLNGARNAASTGKEGCCPVFAPNAASSARPASGCCGANRGRASGNKCRSGNKSTSSSSFPAMFEQILGNVTEDIDEMFLQSAIKQSLASSFNSSSNSSSTADSNRSPSSQPKQEHQQNGAAGTNADDCCFKIFEQLLNVPQQLNHLERKQASCGAGAGAGAGVWAAGAPRAGTNSSSSSISPAPPCLETLAVSSGSNTAGDDDDDDVVAAVAASLACEKKDTGTTMPMVFVSDVSTPASPRSPASTSSTDGGENDSSFVQVPNPVDAESRTAMSQQPSVTITSPLPAVTQLDPEMLWRRELDILREMGFVSIPTTVLVDVLKTELITPAQYGSAPSARGMQRVIDQIAELM